MRMNLPFKWEHLDDYTRRAKVPGGWLIVYRYCDMVALSQVKDEHHEWKIEEEKADPIIVQSNLAKDFEVPSV